MIEELISSISAWVVGKLIPAEYMPLIVIVLTALVAFEQWLASTNRTPANSTFQLIMRIVRKMLNKQTKNDTQNGQDNDNPSGMSKTNA